MERGIGRLRIKQHDKPPLRMDPKHLESITLRYGGEEECIGLSKKLSSGQAFLGHGTWCVPRPCKYNTNVTSDRSRTTIGCKVNMKYRDVLYEFYKDKTIEWSSNSITTSLRVIWLRIRAHGQEREKKKKRRVLFLRPVSVYAAWAGARDWGKRLTTLVIYSARYGSLHMYSPFLSF